MKQASLAVILVAAMAIVPARATAEQDSVLAYHGSSDRSGSFIVPGLTWQSARSTRADETFQARFKGNLYAQPLYWRVPSAGSAVEGRLLVATEDNNVYALDAATGKEIWTRSLGRPVPRSALGCANQSARRHGNPGN
jgi:hypothetical protein